jgi:hypothetical protein
MPILDIFNNDAFSQTSMIATVDQMEYKPTRLNSMNIFTARPIRTENVYIESRKGVLNLIQTTQRGEPMTQRTEQRRTMRNFSTVRIAEGERIQASELAFVRSYGEEQAVESLQEEIARRLSGPGGIMDNIETTFENLRLGAIQGVVNDADGSPIIDWFSEFGVTQATELDFDLDNASPVQGALRKKCVQVVRQMSKASEGAWSPNTRVHALCGDQFFDDLVAHPELREIYSFRQNSGFVEGGGAYETVTYAGITFENYRGTDDGTTVAVGASKCKFFPVNTPGVFLEVMAPGEAFEHLGMLGQKVYPMITRDLLRDRYVDLEATSYPLHVCTRPKMLQSARRT